MIKIKNKDKILKIKKKNMPNGSKKMITLAIIMFMLIMLAIGVAGGVCYFCYRLLDGKPELKVSDLKSPNSTVIYDAKGNQIYELGLYIRENIDYDDMPNCLIDAFLAVEDSRFFEHPGFDVPRFTKAIIENIASGSFAQGGSTVTMQLVKNTYYSIDDGENSITAAVEGMSGVKRKMQEIILALELDQGNQMSKQDIIASYINKVNYGDNIRGVEKASEYYFGKRASDINYIEAAFLAGVINAPTYFNPYNELDKYESYYLDSDESYIENANNRKDEVLYLMYYHGYISKLEYELGCQTRIEDIIKGKSDNFNETSEIFQQYIDVVIDEAYELTGEDPYTTPMQIYTSMDPHMQQVVYDIQNEAEYTGISFPNELLQDAIVILNNQTGEIVALGGGRGENESSRNFNRAADSYINPGSAMKPILEYALAFENLKWATSHVITDRPIWLDNSDILIQNSEEVYFGDVTLVQALGLSLNTCAIQVLESVIDKMGTDYCVDYLNSIGFEFNYEDFNTQYAIGGSTCVVTPLQLAAAHAMLINDGIYIKPHTIVKVDIKGSQDSYVSDTQGTRVLSSEAAWQTAYLEYTNVYESSNSMDVLETGYPVYAKTGTADYGESGEWCGIPYGARKAGNLVAQTNKYTVGTWLGFDKAEEGAYFTDAQYDENTKGKICAFLINELYDYYTEDYHPEDGIAIPEGITTITHILGAYPYAYPAEGYQSITGYISKEYLQENPLVDVNSVLAALPVRTLDGNVKGIHARRNGTTLTLDFYAYSGIDILTNKMDISTINRIGDVAIAWGRYYFPHYIYVGINPTVYWYQINIGEQMIATGVTVQSVTIEVPEEADVTVYASTVGTLPFSRVIEHEKTEEELAAEEALQAN